MEPQIMNVFGDLLYRKIAEFLIFFTSDLYGIRFGVIKAQAAFHGARARIYCDS